MDQVDTTEHDSYKPGSLPAFRARDDDHPYWDNYATQEDIIEFMKPFRDSIWNAPHPRI